MFAEIALFSPPYTILTYSLPADFPENFWQAGMRVLIPLGKSTRSGLILSFKENVDTSLQYRDIIWPMEVSPFFNKDYLAMVNDLSDRNGISPGVIYANILPAGLRQTNIKILLPNSRPQILNEKITDRENIIPFFVNGTARLSTYKDDHDEIYILKKDPPWNLRPQAVRQLKVLDYLYQNGPTSISSISKKLEFSASKIINLLFAKGYIKICDEKYNLLPPANPIIYNLTDAQKNAIDALKNAFDQKEDKTWLLKGITGSGKTAVYAEIIKYCLNRKKSAILLAPEVALAQKLYRDFQNFLPSSPIFFYNGYQTARKREKTWHDVKHNNQPLLLIGTRSSLFLPVQNIGCIILDEEHDSSYKQDEVFSYHAKDLAWYKIKQANGLLVLGSATPDVRTSYATYSGHLKSVELPSRIGLNPLPPIELVDISKYSAFSSAGNCELLARETQEALTECLKNKEQSIILLNRRGYAPMIYCLDCKKTLLCPECSIGLSYHKNLGKLMCHFCGYTRPWPDVCPVCKKMNYLPIGDGTEKLTEHLEVLAGQPLLRLDRDTVRSGNKIDEILNNFSQQKSPFLIGTQMLSKGHHFPNVTLAIIADGDIGLNLPDYRAGERTFQLLVQAAGRAGRGEKPGRVIIQTRNPHHQAWNFIKNYDYEGFYKVELERRKKLDYPPFTQIALLRISFPKNFSDGFELIKKIGACLRNLKQNNCKILGPAPSPLSMLRGQYRFQCLLKSSRATDFRAIYFQLLNSPLSHGLKIFLDIDPVNML